MLKKLISLAVPALLFSFAQIQAFEVRDLIGTWDGSHRETVKGKGRTLNTSLYGSKTADGTVRLVENASSWSIKATYLFKKNGNFSCRTVQFGTEILGSYSGKWSVKNGVINISASGTEGKLTGTVKATKGGFQFSGNSSKTQIVIKATEE